MSTLEAVVFTRPYPIGLGDYTFFVRPGEFVKDRKFFDAHIRNVLHEDDSGAIGSIRGRRWHVLRRGDLVVVGMATNEFGRSDEGGRAIRGYYGFVMPANDVKLPSETLFKELDKVCVEPAFMQAPVRTKDSDCLSGELFDDPAQYMVALDSHKWCFNTNPNLIRFHCSDDVAAILSSALFAASQNPEFEIVIGLNTIEHAKRLPILNCVCHAVSTAQDMQLSVRSSALDSTSTQKSDPEEGLPNNRPSGRGPFAQGGPSPSRKPSIWERILGHPAGPHKDTTPLDDAIRSKDVQGGHKKTARSYLEQGFGRKENQGASSDRSHACDDQTEKITKSAGDAVKEKDTPLVPVQQLKTHDAAESADPLIKTLQALARLQDEIDGMRKGANPSVSLTLERINDSLKDAMICGGATQIDGDALFDAHFHRAESMDEVKDGTLIAETKRPGWRIGDQVLRRAWVDVHSF